VIKVLIFEKCFRSRGNVYQCGRDSHLRGRFVRYPSVSLSPTLSRNEKVEQHIRKKTHKPTALRFWVEGGVIPLYVSSVLILCEISPVLPPLITQQNVIIFFFLVSPFLSLLFIIFFYMFIFGLLLFEFHLATLQFIIFYYIKFLFFMF